MRIVKDLTNEMLLNPLTDIEVVEGKFIDLHNSFRFSGIIYNKGSNQLITTFNGDIEGEKVVIRFLNIDEFDISFSFTDSSDKYILLDMFSRGENVNFSSFEDRYFFIDFTNGMHVDCCCKGCLIEYENKD